MPENTFTFPDQLNSQLSADLTKQPGGLPGIRHYVEIKSFKVKTTDVSKSIARALAAAGDVIDNGFGAAGAAVASILADLEKADLNTDSNALDGTVLLHIPNDLQSPDIAIEYIDADMIDSAAALAVIKGGLKLIKDGTPLSIDSVHKAAEAAGFTDEAMLQFIPHLLSKIGIKVPEVITNTLAKKTGTVLNPLQTQIFKGIALRSFSLSWNLSPKNPNEARSISEIINFFRRTSRPPKVGQGSFLLGFPNEFEVRFLTGSSGTGAGGEKGSVKTNPFLFKTKRCVITGMTVGHTPHGRFTAFGKHTNQFDGMPVEQTLTLQFKEIQIITREDVEGVSGKQPEAY